MAGVLFAAPAAQAEDSVVGNYEGASNLPRNCRKIVKTESSGFTVLKASPKIQTNLFFRNYLLL